MDKKKLNRLRRIRKIRGKISRLGIHRLVVHRSSQHIYAQIVSPDGSNVLASASTSHKDLRDDIKVSSNAEAAVIIGKSIAKKALECGVDTVAFDRSGFKYHGRVKSLATAARENGLKF